jgi:hypothetical protein
VPIGIPNQHIDPADLTRKKILIVLPIITARTNAILEVVKAARISDNNLASYNL